MCNLFVRDPLCWLVWKNRSPLQAALPSTLSRNSSASRVSPLVSPTGMWNQLTPTAMGNIAQFGWSSDYCRRSSITTNSIGDGSGDIENFGSGGGGGGGGGVNSSSGSTSSNNNSNSNTTNDNKTGSKRTAATASTIGAAMRAAAFTSADPQQQHRGVEHRARSASKLPTPQSDNNAPGAALAGVGSEVVPACRHDTAARDGSGGGVLAEGRQRAGFGSPPRAVSPRAPSPDGRTQLLSPVPVRAGLSRNLRIDVDHGGGWDAGGASSCESRSTPGM